MVKNSVLALSSTFLALGSIAVSVNNANAATFNFSFSNEDGNVAGTVAGTIILPDGNGTFSASNITVTSAPAGLGVSVPFNVFSNLTVFTNTFNVIGGMIASTSSFVATSATSAFVLNDSGTTLFSTGDGANVVEDSNSSTLSYSSQNPPVTTTPEPTSVITLIGLGILGVASKLKKKA